MDTTLNPKQTDPPHVLVARVGEELTHAYDRSGRRMSKSRARMNSFPS